MHHDAMGRDDARQPLGEAGDRRVEQRVGLARESADGAVGGLERVVEAGADEGRRPGDARAAGAHDLEAFVDQVDEQPIGRALLELVEEGLGEVVDDAALLEGGVQPTASRDRKRNGKRFVKK
jgi:hypothetical protein